MQNAKKRVNLVKYYQLLIEGPELRTANIYSFLFK